MEDRSASVDPVLVRLADWAVREALSREAVARRLGVGRPTVAGWFLTLEAIQRGDPPPASARSFQFTSQRPEVQARIAEVLNQPLEALRAESTGTTDESAFDKRTRSLLSDLALDAAPWGEPGQQRHRIAAAAESVADVAATVIVPVYRGRDRSMPYQYQVAVLVEPPEPGTDPDDNRRRIKSEVEQTVSDAGLDCYWEYGPAQPSIRLRSEWRELELLGSLAVPGLEAVRAPRTGMLVSGEIIPSRQRYLRLGLVISSSYGGSRPIAGWLSAGSGAGHIPAETWLRLADRSATWRPAGTTAPVLPRKSEGTAPEAGFALHKVIHQLQRGDIPGAWLVSMEAKAPLDYDPLYAAITQLAGVVMVVRLSKVWQHLAAWRRAGSAIYRQLSAMSTGTRVAGLSDTEPFTHSVATPEGEAAFLDHQSQAAGYLEAIRQRERFLGELIERRNEEGLPTIEVTLGHLPDDLMCVRLDGGTYTQVHGEDRLAEMVAFEDSVNPMMDEWRKLAAEFAEKLKRFAGPRE
jgi:hypothetical protein